MIKVMSVGLVFVGFCELRVLRGEGLGSVAGLSYQNLGQGLACDERRVLSRVWTDQWLYIDWYKVQEIIKVLGLQAAAC